MKKLKIAHQGRAKTEFLTRTCLIFIIGCCVAIEMANYIDGPENRDGINYYTLRITPPPVSKSDPKKNRLDPVQVSKLYSLDGNFVIMDESGRWVSLCVRWCINSRAGNY